jgi:hypothetical protein
MIILDNAPAQYGASTGDRRSRLVDTRGYTMVSYQPPRSSANNPLHLQCQTTVRFEFETAE